MGVGFVLALIIVIFSEISKRNKMNEHIRKSDANPYNTVKSDNWYKAQAQKHNVDIKTVIDNKEKYMKM
jgi:hypothetical protein